MCRGTDCRITARHEKCGKLIKFYKKKMKKLGNKEGEGISEWNESWASVGDEKGGKYS